MTRRVLKGPFPDGGFGMRVSEAGYDVMSNPVDPTRLNFSSEWPSMFPLHTAGQLASGNLFTGAGSKTITFTSLGYVPLATIMFKGSVVQNYSTPQWCSLGAADEIYADFDFTGATAGSDFIRARILDGSMIFDVHLKNSGSLVGYPLNIAWVIYRVPFNVNS